MAECIRTPLKNTRFLTKTRRGGIGPWANPFGLKTRLQLPFAKLPASQPETAGAAGGAVAIKPGQGGPCVATARGGRDPLASAGAAHSRLVHQQR